MHTSKLVSRRQAPIRLASGITGLILAVTAITGCGSDSEGRGPEATVSKFIVALAAGDGSRACGRLEPEAQRALEKATKGANCLDAVAKFAAANPTFAPASPGPNAVTTPAAGATPPPAGTIANTVQYTGESANVKVPGGSVPGVAPDGVFTLFNSEAGWGITTTP